MHAHHYKHLMKLNHCYNDTVQTKALIQTVNKKTHEINIVLYSTEHRWPQQLHYFLFAVKMIFKYTQNA